MISALSAGDRYYACFNGIGASNPTYDPASPFCQGILRAPAAGNGMPLSVAISPQNHSGIKTSGIDVQFNLNTPPGPGRAGLSVVVNYLDSFKQSLSAKFYSLNIPGRVAAI